MRRNQYRSPPYKGFVKTNLDMPKGLTYCNVRFGYFSRCPDFDVNVSFGYTVLEHVREPVTYIQYEEHVPGLNSVAVSYHLQCSSPNSFMYCIRSIFYVQHYNTNNDL